MPPIWHLAIECSANGGSVALLKNSHLEALPVHHGQTILPADRGSVQTLAPAIDALLREAQLRVGDLKFISVTVGPGSFTGLRVGLATAKMLAMASQIPIAPVDTLAAIAQRFAVEQGSKLSEPVRLVTAINAFRKQVFTASWTISGSSVSNMRRSSVVDLNVWREDPWGVDVPKSPNTSHNHQNGSTDSTAIWLSGSALELTPAPTGPVPTNVPASVRTADASLWQPLAEQVGVLGWENYVRGGAISAGNLAPNYIRASAAEEKLRT